MTLNRSTRFLHQVYEIVTTILGSLKKPVKPGKPNICAEIKLCLFLFKSTLELICRETEILETKQLVLTKYKWIFQKNFFLQIERNYIF